jgi:hypothetical protein
VLLLLCDMHRRYSCVCEGDCVFLCVWVSQRENISLHMRPFIHIHISTMHTYIYTHKHKLSHTHTHAHKLSLSHTYTTHTNTNSHTRTHKHTHTWALQARALLERYVETRMDAQTKKMLAEASASYDHVRRVCCVIDV